ncbi:MAG: hypothetical protein D6741_11045 [Planctomycetota bacterium]|nr:MAG: hypothetical protein D6741_11045 [Planctomycetota bacterium]
MAFFLIVSLAGVAALFFLAGADFVGAMQVMIYVGGTVVLLAFGVMLTSQSRFVKMKTGADQWILAAFIAASLLAVLLQAGLSLPQIGGNVAVHHPSAAHGDDTSAEVASPAGQETTATENAVPYVPPPVEPESARLGMALLGLRTDSQAAAAANDSQESVEAPISDDAPQDLSALDPADGRSGYLLPFEIVSVHLLVALIGAAYLARARVRREANSDDEADGASS